MSAFDLLSFKPINDLSAASASAGTSEPTSRPEPAARPFRDQLAEADQDASRLPRGRGDVEATRPRVEVATDADATAVDDAQAKAALNEPDAETVTAEVSPAGVDAEVEVDDAADIDTDTDNDVDGGVSPAAEFVLDLIAAFEQVLEDNPIAQTLIAPSTNGEASALPGLTALYEALTAVSATLGAQGGLGSAGLAGAATAAVAPGLTPPPTLPAGAFGPAEVSGLTVSGDNTAAQTQNESAGGQNSQGQTPGNPSNPALLASGESGPLATANATNAALPLPGFDPVASNTAAQPVTPLVNNSSAAGTDVSARLNPAGLTDATTTNDAVNAARLSRGLNNAVNQQGGTVTLRLTPPDLGTVRIQLNLQGTNVSAQFHAETDSAQRLLTQQLGQLRASLESQGLNVDKLGVQAMSPSSNSSSLQQQTSSDNPQSQTNPDGRSRGQFGQSSQQNNQGRDDNGERANFTQLLNPEFEAQSASVLGSLAGAA